MGQGTLPLGRFKEYLVQDYLYLVSPFLHPTRSRGVFVDNLIFQRFNSLEATPLPPTKQNQWIP